MIEYLEQEIIFNTLTFLELKDINNLKLSNKKIGELKLFNSDFLWANIILNNPNCKLKVINQNKEIKYDNYILTCSKLSNKEMYKEIKRIRNNGNIFDRKDKSNRIYKKNDYFNDIINFSEIARY